MIRTEIELRFIIDMTKPTSDQERVLTLEALEICRKQRILRQQPTGDIDAVAARLLQSLPPTLRELRNETERDCLIAAMTRCRGNLVRVSALLGVSRPTVHDLLAKYDINANDYRRPPALEASVSVAS